MKGWLEGWKQREGEQPAVIHHAATTVTSKVYGHGRQFTGALVMNSHSFQE